MSFKHLFIVGCGRSGTTMLQQALNRHPRILIPPETGYFLDFIGHTLRGQRRHLRSINRDLGIDLPMPDRRVRNPIDVIAWYQRIAEAYTRIQRREGVEYFGDKSPRHLLRLERIASFLPEARILLIYRDGRDVAISLSKVPWSPPDVYVNFAIWLRFYRWHQWALRQPNLHLIFLKYEDFVSDPEAHLRRVCEFLNVDYVPEMTEGRGGEGAFTEHETAWKASSLEAINTSRIGVSKSELSETRLRRLERWGEKALTSLGYELIHTPTTRLPLWFFPRLYAKHSAWRLKCAIALATKELFDSPISRTRSFALL